MPINQYLERINKLYKTGNAREHSYRGDLQNLINAIEPEVVVTNEPARIECGAPDYIITKHDIPVGYIEAKDIGVDLESKSHKEQFDRYKSSLQNLIITDYLSFLFYVNGEFKTKINIAEIKSGKIVPIPEHFKTFNDLIRNFCLYKGQTIKSSSTLAAMMAKKARMLESIIESALVSDIKKDESSSLRDQINAFQKILIHDINPKEFADIYAQTIAYGMFAARFHDKTLDTFSRQEAAELIPKSNPFLRSLFSYIAGPDIDDRIKWIVESLAEIFRSADVASLLIDFGKATQTQDPVIHFYETFLTEYDPVLRKARGVWYTPSPIVKFIVRAVDEILKTEFGIKEGVADNSMFEINVKHPGEKKAIKKKVHRVQILDPATGTGTFIAELIRQVYQRFQGQEGIWSNYVDNHLIPRLHGFEILMASYAMAHLKIEMMLQDTFYKSTKNPRLKIYLTNALEEYREDDGTLFSLARWLSEEARQANDVKRDTPVMVVMGNPPYSVSSSNKSDWILSLIADYKKGLNEKNIQPLSDDYIKFIRFGQHFIDKTGEGILAFISNNSFIDGLIHRQMRKSLLESFDKIYILDLHGNAKKKEISPDGTVDHNVFDIMQGVSINIFIKTNIKKKKKLSEVFHYDLFGKREFKYEFLAGKMIKNVQWNNLDYAAPDYYFVKKNFKGGKDYKQGFSLGDLFILSSSGVETGNDKKYIQFSTEEFENVKIDNFKFEKLKKINYRPFDIRYCYYDNGLLRRAAFKNLKNFMSENIGLAFPRQSTSLTWSHIQVVKDLFDNRAHYSNKGRSLICPLYIYPDSENPLLDVNESRKPNLNIEIVNEFMRKLKIPYTEEKETIDKSFSPIDIIDYIYGVLHSPTYRRTYKEFLRVDFPRVPYPSDKKTFLRMAKLGSELRGVHLLEADVVNNYITSYPIGGDNVVRKVKYQNGNVYINDSQYFTKIPEVAWNFTFGGYQPAQKWLDERVDRELTFEEILHYQKIIVALMETDKIMKVIDRIKFE